MSSVYGMIMGRYIVASLKTKIEARKDFTNRIRNKPIQLLKAIMEVTNESYTNKYPYMTEVNNLIRLLTSR
mgnify:CR=1 FL=1